MDDHDGVLPSLDDFVEIADGAISSGGREWTVDPNRLFAADEVASREIAGGQVVMASDRDKRPSQSPRHVLDESRLPTARRTLEHHRQPALVTLREDVDLVRRGEVVRLVLKPPGAVFQRGAGGGNGGGAWLDVKTLQRHGLRWNGLIVQVPDTGRRVPDNNRS